MSHHGLMRMEDLGPEDFDHVDESDILAVNEARPVRGDEVDVDPVGAAHARRVRRARRTSTELDDKTIIEAARDAIRAYIAAHAAAAGRPRRRAS